ncbi:MAG: NAD(P)H-binding protein, partial [Proteobacteria bacterium]|nr:NAD(P)H-binding protein [Pseudomonadota bacterium]
MRGGTILVIGAYGLIGSAVARRLAGAGHKVRGLGRSAARGRRLVPGIDWVEGDLRAMTAPDDWTAALDGVATVVNAAGVLQDGARDSLRAVHDTAIRALLAACAARGVKRFVQISAAGVSPGAATEFFRSKARGDRAVRASGLEWVILRPGLVIGPDATGGTALLRGLAAFPLVQPLVLGDAPVQTVALAD